MSYLASASNQVRSSANFRMDLGAVAAFDTATHCFSDPFGVKLRDIVVLDVFQDLSKAEKYDNQSSKSIQISSIIMELLPTNRRVESFASISRQILINGEHAVCKLRPIAHICTRLREQ